jgi:hypothetical protein
MDKIAVNGVAEVERLEVENVAQMPTAESDQRENSLPQFEQGATPAFNLFDMDFEWEVSDHLKQYMDSDDNQVQVPNAPSTFVRQIEPPSPEFKHPSLAVITKCRHEDFLPPITALCDSISPINSLALPEEKHADVAIDSTLKFISICEF